MNIFTGFQLTFECSYLPSPSSSLRPKLVEANDFKGGKVTLCLPPKTLDYGVCKHDIDNYRQWLDQGSWIFLIPQIS